MSQTEASTEMSVPADMQSWMKCPWVRAKVKTIKKLYDTSIFRDDDDTPFDLLTSTLDEIKVPVRCGIGHPDVERGLLAADAIERNKLYFILKMILFNYLIFKWNKNQILIR